MVLLRCCVIVVACAVILSALLPYECMAQKNEGAPTVKQTIRLYEGVLSFPPPVWLEEGRSINDLKTYRNQTTNSFSFEQIPETQKIESWTRLYGVYAWALPEYDMPRFVEESYNALALGCKESPRVKVMNDTGDSFLMTYHCGDLVDQLVVDNNNVESGFLFMGRVDQSFAKVYLAWRGDKKNIKTESWHLNDEVIEKAVKAMSQIRYFKP